MKTITTTKNYKLRIGNDSIPTGATRVSGGIYLSPDKTRLMLTTAYLPADHVP